MYITADYQSRIDICKDKNWNTLWKENKVIGRWVQYFVGLLNGEVGEEDGYDEDDGC